MLYEYLEYESIQNRNPITNSADRLDYCKIALNCMYPKIEQKFYSILHVLPYFLYLFLCCDMVIILT